MAGLLDAVIGKPEVKVKVEFDDKALVRICVAMVVVVLICLLASALIKRYT
jgi:hypothetical protein